MWKKIRGYKRQAGAVMAILPMILNAFGVDDGVAQQVLTVVALIGTIVWGIGWADRTAVMVSSKFKKNMEKHDPVLHAANEALRK